MECEYSSIDEECDRDLSFIKIYNQGQKYLVNRVQGNVSFKLFVFGWQILLRLM